MRFARPRSRAMRLSFTWSIRFPPRLFTTTISSPDNKAQLREMAPNLVLAGYLEYGMCLAQVGH